MSKTVGRKRGKRRMELILLLVLVAALANHLAVAKRQADLETERSSEQAARKQAVELFRRLSTEGQRTIVALPKTAPEVELWLVNRHLKRNPTNIELLRTRASIQANLGQLRLALQDLDRILDLAPTDYDALMFHAFYSADVGLHEEAIADIEKVERLFKATVGEAPFSVLALHAQYLSEGGRFEEALVVAQEANSMKPNDPEILKTLGDIYQGLGDHQAAIEANSRSTLLDNSEFLSKLLHGDSFVPVENSTFLWWWWANE